MPSLTASHQFSIDVSKHNGQTHPCVLGGRVKRKKTQKDDRMKVPFVLKKVKPSVLLQASSTHSTST